MKIFIFFITFLVSLNSHAHRGEVLAIENVNITESKGQIHYSFLIENIIGKTIQGVNIEFIKNGQSIDEHYIQQINSDIKFISDEFVFSSEDINLETDLIQIEITQIFYNVFDWGGWDSPTVNKQVNTLNSEFYVDAPWRMKKTDGAGSDVAVPVHFFLHDADLVSGFTLKIDYIDIKVKSASAASFGTKLTYNTISTASFNNMFSCSSITDGAMSVKAFDLTDMSPTSSNTLDFDGETDFFDDFVSVDDTYWYFTFNIPASDLIGLGDVIDIQATIAYANTLITGDDVISMRVFRSDSEIPTQAGYYRGDTHLHSIYTQSDAEVGLPLCATKEAAQLIGLDWITTTDHTSDFDNYGTNINSNWAALQTEAATLNTLDPSLIYIAGQEVAVNNSENKLVHMLAYPGYLDPFDLPFLGDGNGDLTATVISIDSVISQLILVDGFSFCAHPFATMDELPSFPVNGGIWNLGDAGFPVNGSQFLNTGGPIVCNDLARPSDILSSDADKLLKDAIKGSQIWNLRANLEVSGLSGDELDPWDVTSSGTSLTQIDTTDYSFHYKRLQQGFEVVNHVNMLGLLLKNSNSSAQNWKMFFSAGADAHGSFNSSNTDNVGGVGTVHNNAVGKVNSVVYCPNGMGNNGEEVLKSLYNGNFSMSDGPLITMGISTDGPNLSNEIIMGEDALLNVYAEDDIYINFNYSTTAEFGDFVRFNFIVGTPLGEVTKVMSLATNNGDVHESILLIDLLESIYGVSNTPVNEFLYVRAEIETFVDYSASSTIYRTDFDYFHSYTNPIWIKRDLSAAIQGNNSRSFSVYPNPASNEVNIEFTTASEFVDYILYNKLGQVVSNQPVTSSILTINLSEIASGIYNLVLISQSGELVSTKIVKL